MFMFAFIEYVIIHKSLSSNFLQHCIGNGWSIPVVEHMLGKLKDLFPDDMMKEYDGYTYKYPWEPYLSM